MAYMRGNPYIYGNGRELVITMDGATVLLPDELANDLAAMLWHRLTPQEQQETLERVADSYAGNFGADGVLAALGRPTSMQSIIKALEQKD